MRSALGSLVMVAFLASACASDPIDADQGMGGTSGSAGTGNAGMPAANPCSGALRQELSLVEQVSTGSVAVLSQTGSELVVYVDATAGGIDGQDQNPWVYISLASGQAIPLDDLQALTSLDWDLALKRFVIRTNSGDSGPGQGGAIKVMLGWDEVDASTLGTRQVAVEDWFDDDCNLTVDAATGDLITTFSGWSEYNEATHVLAPADAVFLTQAADGSLYKVAILEYYSTPSGGHGTIAGRYQLRIAPLP